ncbi:unnamed protein product [Sphenostylis stenocarpa]|uniref:Uncharacterized protein n=1 Tax=Sphenostylis stenocarpa TaxID=92480 RepID=A0AA86S0S7_9FABA|nr:unnamed protein product [Sphenostylis stenocarpa]
MTLSCDETFSLRSRLRILLKQTETYAFIIPRKLGITKPGINANLVHLVKNLYAQNQTSQREHNKVKTRGYALTFMTASLSN